MKHTPGLLEVFNNGDNEMPGINAITEGGGRFPVVIYGDDKGDNPGVRGRNHDEAKANAQRLVTCWNACEGITTKALEGGVVKELREALEATVQLLQDYWAEFHAVEAKSIDRKTSDRIASARVALAKAKP